jgi:hypothetical protein
MDITKIPLDELKKDLKDSEEDANVCSEAIKLGISIFKGKLVSGRLEANKYFIKVITEELKRRESLCGN